LHLIFRSVTIFPHSCAYTRRNLQTPLPTRIAGFFTFKGIEIMGVCIELYIEDDGTMAIAVEQNAPEPEETGEQKTPVKSLDEAIAMITQIAGELASQGGAQAEPGQELPPEGDESFEQGFAGARGSQAGMLGG
jgi:hypothetical protein